jgi:hypothetical protein
MGAVVIVGLPIAGGAVGAVVGGVVGFMNEGASDVPGFGLAVGILGGGFLGIAAGVAAAAMVVG